MVHYKIAWNFPGRRVVVNDVIAADLNSVLKQIKNAHGVSTETVETLYVHRIHTNGSPEEVYAHEGRVRDSAVEQPKATAQALNAKDERVISNIKEIIMGKRARKAKRALKMERKDKPHVKLSLDPAKPLVSAGSGLWFAAAAPVRK